MDSKISMADSSKRPSKRLLFDRRYGWVIDEWKDPSEEALAGGRGMFCILLLTKTLMKTVSQSISLAGRSAVKALERTELLLPQIVQDGLNDRLHKFTSSLENPKFNCFFLKGNSQSKDISCSSHLNMDSSESKTA
ncbi:Retrotransposon protein putative Ty1-copia subclass [Fagus crenata]